MVVTVLTDKILALVPGEKLIVDDNDSDIGDAAAYVRKIRHEKKRKIRMTMNISPTTLTIEHLPP